MELTAQDKQQNITAIRSDLMISHRYLTRLILECSLSYNYGSVVPCTVDSRRIYISDAFFEYEWEQQLSLFISCVLHMAFRHAVRCRYRDKYKFAICADVVINNMIQRADLRNIVLPTWAVTFKHPVFAPALEIKIADEWDVEALYEWYLTNVPEDGTQYSLEIFDLEPEDIESLSDNESTEQLLESKWAGLLDNAGSQAGSHSKAMLKNVRVYDSGKTPWNKLLKPYAMEAFAEDRITNYSRPNRRYLAKIGFYSPSKQKDKSIRLIVIVVDTSGSCFTEKVLTVFCSEIESLRKQVSCNLVIFGADTKVASMHTIDIQDKSKLGDIITQLKGGGGTCFAKPIAEAVALKPNLIIYITDGHTSNWGDAQGIPTIFCVDTTEVAPYGKTIRLVNE